ncbi:hypothetical protein DSL64_02800 [Dyadobacter luteus]|uniref:YjbH domain-containing protein n=1 Tax=Dyadobacter luteus TaxID=2259619 RepID=A0A3D8YI31_9BACT|nr:YjbH domain-containing protein [Dyadobacter luteus]REA64493.1 hypothetical protein DSL64_02800 [Dyadobacter luteus]
MNPKKGSISLSFFLLFWALGAAAQVNNSGKPGIIFTPSAVETQEGLFRFGYNYVPQHYSLRKRGVNPERVIYANITIFKRLEINANLLQMISTDQNKVKEGIGDRQLDLRYLILKEKSKFPSLAVIITTPFTIDGAMLTHALVATKNFEVGKDLKLEASVGYGSPYYLYRDESNLTNSNMLSNFKWKKKSEDRYKNHYLQGPFGGAVLHYKNLGGVMAEWDSKHVNVGAYARLFKVWTIQAGLLDGKQLTAGTSVAINLLKPSRRLKQQADEKN